MLVSANIAQVLSAVIPGLGVNWGTMASHLLPPNIVVKMLKDNGINKVKLFDADAWTVNSLAGSGIEVMLGIPNNQLHHIAKHYDNAEDWVKKNVTKHLYSGGVDIKLVHILFYLYLILLFIFVLHIIVIRILLN